MVSLVPGSGDRRPGSRPWGGMGPVAPALWGGPSSQVMLMKVVRGRWGGQACPLPAE